ncbi:MAG TPA: hypothetical protein VGH00_01865 [Chthoniobacterales bacterium]|jgi:hypothetical protein
MPIPDSAAPIVLETVMGSVIGVARGSRIAETTVRSEMNEVVGRGPMAPDMIVRRNATVVRKFRSNRSP